MLKSWRRVEKIALVLLILLGAMAATSALMQLQTASPEPIYFVPGRPYRVALTFETRWSDKGLSELLEILKEEDVAASFFLTGSWLEKHPGAAARILEQGHEIGNHTLNHAVLLHLSKKEIEAELEGFNAAAKETLEYRSSLFRPPRGLYNGIVLEIARRQRCRTVLWSIESYDYLIGPDELNRRIKKRLHHGAIILFRAGAPSLTEALPKILAHMREEGYRPVTVSELLENKDGETRGASTGEDR